MASYHSAKGPVDYTVVGSPTIVNGIVSNFSNSNSLNLTAFPLYANRSFEIFAKVKLSEVGAISNGIMGNGANFLPGYYSYDGIEFRQRAAYEDAWANTIRLASADGVNIAANTWFYFKETYDGAGTLTGAFSSDGQTWISKTLTGVSNFPNSTTNIKMGGSVSGSPIVSELDLNETYITVDGQPWFGNCPVEVKKHQLMGSVGYTKEGNPIIVDGVASWFSQNDYLQTSNVFPNDINSFDAVIKFNCSDLSTPNTLYSSISTILPFGLSLRDTGKLRLYCGNAGNSIDSTTSFVANTNYLAKISYVKNTGWSLLTSSDNGVNWNTEFSGFAPVLAPQSNYITIGRNFTGTNKEPFVGSIDLNQTYIKVNGKLWFYQSAPTKYIQKDNKLVFASQDLYLKGPESYTAVGNPTITKGVVSGFSTNDYISLDDVLPVANTLEIVVAFKTDFQPSTSNQWLISGLRNLMIGVNTNHKLVYYFGFGTGDDWSVSAATGNYTFSANTDYLIKLTFDGSEYAFYVSSDNGRTWTFDTSYQTSEKLGSKVLSLGINAIKSTPLSGSIDLNKTYIKANGELCFGKNYATKNIAPVPSGYTYGNTTTSAIGYVDMRTQGFTAAPAGATIGRDE